VKRQGAGGRTYRCGLEPDAGGLMPMVADLLSPVVGALAWSVMETSPRLWRG